MQSKAKSLPDQNRVFTADIELGRIEQTVDKGRILSVTPQPKLSPEQLSTRTVDNRENQFIRTDFHVEKRENQFIRSDFHLEKRENQFNF